MLSLQSILALADESAASEGLDVALQLNSLDLEIALSTVTVELRDQQLVCAPLSLGVLNQSVGANLQLTLNQSRSFNTSTLLTLAPTSAMTGSSSHLPACGCFVHKFIDADNNSTLLDGASADPGVPQFSGANHSTSTWIASLDSGTRWNYTGSTTSLTYSFYSGAGLAATFGPLSEVARNFVRQVFQDISTFVNLSFVEVNDSTPGQLRIQTTHESGYYAYAYYPGSGIGGDVFFGSSYDNASNTNGWQTGIGSHGFASIIHEISHALGLKHSGNYNGSGAGSGPFLAFGDDNQGNTVMTYNFAGRSPASLMPFDILTLQSIYGARSWNPDNTTYTFSRISQFSDGTRTWGSATADSRLTLWDSAGTDTLNFAALASNSGGYRFDLNEGGWLSLRSEFNTQTYKATGDTSGTQYLTTSRGTRLAYGVSIENLVGTSSNDEIIGNALANLIRAGDGNDTISGGNGNDIIDGEGNDDTLNGDAGNDALYGGAGNDTLNGGDGDDFLSGGTGTNILNGGAGNDNLDGTGGGTDTLIGGTGDDNYGVVAGDTVIENAGEGFDTIYAYTDCTLPANVERLILVGGAINGIGNSADNIIGANGILGSAVNGMGGNDALYGGAGNDTLNGGDGDDFLAGGQGSNTLIGGVGNDSLDGAGGGIDTLMGGVGDDSYGVGAGDTVIEAAGEGFDTVYAYVNYTLGANLERLILVGVAFTGIGNELDNTIMANATIDSLLAGMAGNDILAGGSGNDQFLFGGSGLNFSNMGVDTLLNFAGGDRINLSKTTFAALASGVGGVLSASEFATVTLDAQAETTAALIVYNASNGNLFYNQNGSAAGFGAGGQFATLSGAPGLAAGSFNVVG